MTECPIAWSWYESDKPLEDAKLPKLRMRMRSTNPPAAVVGEELQTQKDEESDVDDGIKVEVDDSTKVKAMS